MERRTWLYLVGPAVVVATVCAFPSRAAETQSEAPSAAEVQVVGDNAEPPADSAEGAQAPEEAGADKARADELRDRRLAKEPTPPHQGILEWAMVKTQDRPLVPLITVPFHDLYLRPGTLRSGGGLSLSLEYWNADRAESWTSLFASAGYSTGGYQDATLLFGRVPHGAARTPPLETQLEDLPPLSPRAADYGFGPYSRYLFGEVRYRDLPRETFYGLGPGSAETDKTSFLMKDVSYELVGLKRLAHPLLAALRIGSLHSEIGSGQRPGVPTIETLFDDTTAPGLSQQPDYLHAGAELLLDWRDEPRNPHRGGAIGLSGERYSDPGHQFSFNRYVLDVRHVLTLGSPQRVLAARGYASAASADPGDRVPFYLLETLGGARTLRGYADFRYRAPALALLSAEYRWELIPAVELAAFCDTGTVGERLTELRFADRNTSCGGGLRLKAKERTLLRFDVSRGGEETRFLVKTFYVF